jgi:hypothetical protein
MCSEIVVVVFSFLGCNTTESGGDGGDQLRCKSGDDLFIINTSGVSGIVNIEFPDETFCVVDLTGEFGSITSIEADSVLGEVFTFGADSFSASLISPEQHTCTVSEIAVQNGVATVELLLPTPNFTNQLLLEWAVNWESQ